MRAALILVAFVIAMLAAGPIRAAQPEPLSGTVVLTTKLSFDRLLERTQQAIEASGMLLVCKASASQGAAARGLKIPGNAVLMVFRNDYAVRMLVRLYVTESGDGSATLTYRKPSAVFRPYGSAALDTMAAELDAVFDKIASDAVRD